MAQLGLLVEVDLRRGVAKNSGHEQAFTEPRVEIASKEIVAFLPLAARKLELGLPWPLAGTYRLNGTTLADRLVASLDHKLKGP